MLEEIRRLPQRVIDNLDGDVGNLKVYLVQDYNLKLLNRIVNFGQDLFGELGMDEWGLVPQIRHGNVFILKEEKKNRKDKYGKGNDRYIMELDLENFTK